MTIKMTPAQTEALLKIVRYQQQADKEIIFGLERIDDGAGYYSLRPWSGGDDIDRIPLLYMFLWEKNGYVISDKQTQFILLGANESNCFLSGLSWFAMLNSWPPWGGDD